MRTTLLIIIFSYTINSIACTGYGTTGFELSQYDNANFVAEIKVLKLETDTNLILNIFVGVVREVYKGEIHSDTLFLNFVGKHSSCYWEPEIGKSYIFTFDTIRIDSWWLLEPELELMYPAIFPNDRISSNEFIDLFNFNKRILRLLKNPPENGQLKVVKEQSTELWPFQYSAFSGNYKNGERHGVWKIYEPYESSSPNTPNYKYRVAISLTYKNGKLIAVRNHELDYPDDENLSEIIVSWSEYYKNNLG